MIRTLVTHLGFPILMASALALGAVLLAAGVMEGLVVASISLGGALVIGVGERLVPYSERWKRDHGDTKHDFVHMFISMLVTPELVKAASYFLLMVLAENIATAFDGSLWPDWPIFLSLPVALVIAEFGQYWAHRLMHENKWFWTLHALHHSAPRLYWLNAGRFHFLDVAFGFFTQIPILILLGCPTDVIALVVIFTAIHGMYQHANLPTQIGPLNWVFSMTELHRWHHSRDIAESNSNYGANLIIWDIVFGTRYLPDRPHDPLNVGVAKESEAFPATLAGQIAYPFVALRGLFSQRGKTTLETDEAPASEL